MKRSASVAILLDTLMLLLMSGCLEERVQTTISADGSSERVISMKLLSQEVPDNAFPVPTDSSWSVEWRSIAEKELKYEYVARKRFRTPEELNREYALLPDTAVLGLKVSVEKRFEGFYTYIDYTEVYTFRNPFGNVPISGYLTAEEISRLQRGEGSDSLKQKFEQWQMRGLFEEFYRPLSEEVERRNDPSLPASLFAEKKEECFARLWAVESEKGDSTRKDSLDTPDYVLKLLKGVFNTDAVYGLRPAAEMAWKTIEAKQDRIKHPDGWNYSVQMPGLILETNSDAVEGNMVTWKFGIDKIQVGDYVMHAASRVTNVWVFVVTGLVALVVVLIGVRAAFRRR